MRKALASALVLALALVAAVGVVPAQAELQLGIQDDALLTSGEPNAWPFAKGLRPGSCATTSAGSRWRRCGRWLPTIRPTRPTTSSTRTHGQADGRDRRAEPVHDRQRAALGHGNRAPRYAPASADAYGQFCGVVAWRYSGTYTPPGALVPLPAVKNFTVWNEPNRGQYLMPQGRDGLTAARKFAGLVRACTDAVHAVSPDARVAAGPIASRGAQGGASPIAFLEAYHKAGGPRPQALAFNPYMNGLVPAYMPKEAPADGAITLRNLDQLERWLTKAYGGSVPIWFTEFAWRTAPTPKLGTSRRPSRPTCCARRSRSSAPATLREAAGLVPGARPVAGRLLALGLATFDWQQKPAYGLYKALAGV